MARGTVRIPIQVDPSGVKTGTAKATRDLQAFDKKASATGKGLSGLTGLASGAGLALGAGGLALGLSKSITAFKEQEKATANVIATLKTLGVNTAAVRKQIEQTTTAQSKMSGFQDEELQASFAVILKSTKDVTGALKLNELAMDISRGTGKNLGSVAVALSKATDGNFTALKRYGVQVEKGATVTDVLSAAQKRYAGQAREFGNTSAGAADKATASINELEESLGQNLAPALNEAAGATMDFAGASQSLINEVGGIGPVVAGAAGFGAFKLLGPTLANASGAVGGLARVAGKQGAGASFRVLGSAVGASINPMGAAAIGAGLLAAGVYELWHNSENADDAVRHLGDSVHGLNEALDQKTTARDAVNSAKDYSKTTGDAARAARNRTQALRSERSELERHGASAADLAAKSKEVAKAETTETEAIHRNQRAHHELSAAKRNLELATDGVNVASGEQAEQVKKVNEQIAALTRDTRVAGRTGLVWKDTMGSSAQQAEIFAGKLDKAAAATRKSDTALSRVDSSLATFVRRVQRMPTQREVKIITQAVHRGDTPAEIKRQLDALPAKKTIAVEVRGTVFQMPNPINPTKTLPAASGALVAGSYSMGDRVPALLAGEEAVLNPKQIGMVDSGWSVMGALRATGAPTIGRGFAGGKAPRARDGQYPGFRRRGGKWSVWGGAHGYRPLPGVMPPDDLHAWLEENLMGRGISRANVESLAYWWSEHYRSGRIYADPSQAFAKGKVPQSGGGRVFVSGKAKTPPTKAELVRAALDKRGNVWGLQDARTALRIAQADAAGDPLGNVSAYQADADKETGQIRAIQAILTNPSKALGVKGAVLNPQQRAALLQELASSISQRKDDFDTIEKLRHPESSDAGGDTGGDAGGDTGAGSADADANLQARLDQALKNAADATRSAGLSDASLRALTATGGDIGTGQFGSVLDAARGGPILALGDLRSLQAIGSAATQGMGLQPSVSSNRDAIRI